MKKIGSNSASARDFYVRSVDESLSPAFASIASRVKKLCCESNYRSPSNAVSTDTSVSSIINRGKLLHSAMNSLHNFDRSLDKFLAWLSEAESSMEGLEAEADRLGGRRDQGALRRPQHQLKVRLSRSRKSREYKFPTCFAPGWA